MAGTFQADAVTAGNDVWMAGDHDADSPETMGLLAHELTHVARRQVPRFVPPVVRPDAERAVPVGLSAADGAADAQESFSDTNADEERMALAVEAKARSRAEVRDARTAGGDVAAGDGLAASADPTSLPFGFTAVPMASRRLQPMTTEPVAHAPWGGLPAPWEPLPELGVTPLGMTADDDGAAHSNVSDANGGGTEAGATAAGPVQAAARDRSLPAERSGEPATAHGGSHGQAPDIDTLARQVYDVLKRRLAAERRRGV